MLESCVHWISKIISLVRVVKVDLTSNDRVGPKFKLQAINATFINVPFACSCVTRLKCWHLDTKDVKGAWVGPEKGVQVSGEILDLNYLLHSRDL